MDCTGLAAVSWHFRFLLLPIPKKLQTDQAGIWRRFRFAVISVARSGCPPAQTDVRTLYTVLKADGFNPVGHEMTGTTARLQTRKPPLSVVIAGRGARGPDCQSVFWG